MELIPGLLTIGIPTFNGGANLPELLASVEKLGLTPEQYELLIVDNGSTDETAQIVEQLALIYDNITYYHNNRNIGRVENWNKVIELARGEFLILMNVNDRFMELRVSRYISYLEHNRDVALIMNDVVFQDYLYPNWTEDGLVDLPAYIRKTYLDTDYLEFNSLGVLQQHIFRTDIIRKHGIRFDPKIARTTDRVFIAQAIKAGGGKFYYTGQSLVNWRLNNNRYHFQAHHNADFSFDNLWINEYKANIEVASIAEIPYQKALESQLVYARFLMWANWFRSIKSKIRKKATDDYNIEISTAGIYYEYIKAMAGVNNVHINYPKVKVLALTRAYKWFLRSVKISERQPRYMPVIKKTAINNSSISSISPQYV